VVIAGAKVHRSAGDKFDRVAGLRIASERIMKTVDCGRKNRIAASMENDLNRFSDRCCKYFKTRQDKMVIPEIIPFR